MGNQSKRFLGLNYYISFRFVGVVNKLDPNKCHKQEKCSGVKRYSTVKEWYCSLHRRNTQALPQAEPQEQEGLVGEKVNCNTCKRHIRRDQKMLRCAQCDNFYHKQSKCSGLTREVVRVGVESGTEWICNECENIEDRDYNIGAKNQRNVSERI